MCDESVAISYDNLEIAFLVGRKSEGKFPCEFELKDKFS